MPIFNQFTKPSIAIVVPSFVVSAAAISVFGMAGCQQPAQTQYGYIEGETMGTTYHISYELPQDKTDNGMEKNEQAIKASIAKRLSAINNSMSTWQDDSTISKFNQLPANTPLKIDADFVTVFNDSKLVYQQSGGAFDPTVKPVFELWGFGKEMRVDRLQSPPSDAAVAKAKALIGFDSIVLDGDTLSKAKDGVQVDFSAIAKGYGVDVIADVLKSDYKINNYMVEIGGEVATSGTNNKGQAWQIGIDAPILHSGVTDRKTIAVIRQPANVNNAKQQGSMHLATSGNYRNSIVFDGIRYSHTIDPKAGKPIIGGAPSVTVASTSVALADAWATALTAMAYEDALTVAEQNKLAALFVVPKEGVDVNKDSHKLEDWQVVETDAMQALRQQKN